MKSLTAPRPSVKSKKPAEPVHGTCRWTYLVEQRGSKPLSRHVGVLEIKGTLYAITLLPGGIEVRKDAATVYHVCTCGSHGWTCDCPDAEFRPRPGGCKHVAACRAALAAIGREPMPPAPSIPAVTLEDL